jgi:hypothetical protein
MRMVCTDSVHIIGGGGAAKFLYNERLVCLTLVRIMEVNDNSKSCQEILMPERGNTCVQ